MAQSISKSVKNLSRGEKIVIGNESAVVEAAYFQGAPPSSADFHVSAVKPNGKLLHFVSPSSLESLRWHLA